VPWPSATVTSTVHVASTVALREAGVHSCSSTDQVPTMAVHPTGVKCFDSGGASTDSTSAPEELRRGKRLRWSPCLVGGSSWWSLSKVSGQPHCTSTLSTCAPEKLTRTQPRDGAERMESVPKAPVLLEPWIEWVVGVSDAGRSTWHQSGPQPSVHESDASQEPV